MTAGSRSADEVTVVGLTADTNGLLRPEVMGALQGADLIIHAGDVGCDGILEALRGLAPVRAVRGNVDRGAWAKELPRDELAQIGEVGIYVYHGHEELDLDSKATGCRVVVSYWLGKWSEAGVLERIWRQLLAELEAKGEINLSRKRRTLQYRQQHQHSHHQERTPLTAELHSALRRFVQFHQVYLSHLQRSLLPLG